MFDVGHSCTCKGCFAVEDRGLMARLHWVACFVVLDWPGSGTAVWLWESSLGLNRGLHAQGIAILGWEVPVQ